MLGDILAEIIGKIIGEVIYNLILKPIGLLLFCIFKAIFNFGKWSWEHIVAAAVLVTGLFKKKDCIDDTEMSYGYYESDYVDSSSDRND